MSNKRILNVGQCGFDNGNISRMLHKHFSAEVTAADSKEEALDLARREQFDLVLVNRQLDADGSSGLDIIRALQANDSLKQLPVMLVSNYEDAQKEAVTLGALPGFGKSALEHPQTVSRIAAVLQATV